MEAPTRRLVELVILQLLGPYEVEKLTCREARGTCYLVLHGRLRGLDLETT